jgi:excinuclease ABC subunit C
VALAKKEEEVFTPQGKVSQVSKKLLIKVRDEAHRFAIKYHKTLRRKKLKKSILDDIKGIGEKRKKLLMNHFGSVENMRTCTVEELESVLRNRKMALKVHEHLKVAPSGP